MADLKAFYDLTLPTIENIRRLFNGTSFVSFTKQELLDFSNQTFGMLAHLRIDSTEKLWEAKNVEGYHSLKMICKNLRILNENGILNSSAIPMIQRYMKIFDAYEKQNGLNGL